MSENKKYYYLKLKDNFYNSDEIKILEAMPNGYEYSSFYLKLCLMSLKEDGRLVFKGRIPYNPEMLATITGHNVDVIKVALDTFVGMEMISILDTGAMFVNDIQALIGRGSSEAERKKLYRNRISKESLLGQTSGHRPPEIEIEIELENRDKTISSEPEGSDKEADKKLEEEFERFWNLYQKKDNRKGCWSKWQKLKTADKDKIFETLPAYVNATPDPKYRKNPATYLNQEAWNNEIIPAEGAHKGDRFTDPTYYGKSTYKDNDVF